MAPCCHSLPPLLSSPLEVGLYSAQEVPRGLDPLWELSEFDSLHKGISKRAFWNFPQGLNPKRRSALAGRAHPLKLSGLLGPAQLGQWHGSGACG